ncbi:MAG TPA: tol-pal system protein YbgF [Methylophilaceae bacterium]|jgi:tol-pal system protein YbgF
MRNLILASLLVLSQTAHAALFDDTEARKKIVELQQQMQSQNQSTQASLNELKSNQQALEKRITDLENTIKGLGVVDLLNQIDRLNQDLSKVKGDLEVANHNIQTGQDRQKDLYVDVDGRLRKLEGGTTPVANTPTTPATASPTNTATAEVSAEAKDYEAAQDLSKSGKYKEAFEAYTKFLQTYPNSTMAPDAQYALGYAQFSLKNYKASMTTQQKLIKQYPDSPKVPEALFNIANSQIQLSDVDGAKNSLRSLLSKYPDSSVAPAAKKRLTVLDSISKAH